MVRTIRRRNAQLVLNGRLKFQLGMIFSQHQWVQLFEPRVPEGFATPIAELIGERPLQIRITAPRATKYGDYRPPLRVDYHRITINNNLNPYAFLVTLVHELAHLYVWEAYKGSVKPHGVEWKRTFNNLMHKVTQVHFLPGDLHRALTNYLQNPGASSCSDPELFKVLRNYDAPNDFQFLEELPDGAHFQLPGGRKFIRQERLRKRYRCTSLDNGRKYLVNALAEVKSLGQN